MVVDVVPIKTHNKTLFVACPDGNRNKANGFECLPYRNTAKQMVFDVVPIETQQQERFLMSSYRNTAKLVVVDVVPIETQQN